MKKRALLCLGIAALSLTACKNGTKEVSYEDFKNEIEETAKKELPTIKSFKINGYFEQNKEKYEAKNLYYEDGVSKVTEYTVKELSIISVVGVFSAFIHSIPNDENTKYYVGNGFRARDTSAELAWDENLNFTTAVGVFDGGEIDLKVSYTYVK